VSSTLPLGDQLDLCDTWYVDQAMRGGNLSLFEMSMICTSRNASRVWWQFAAHPSLMPHTMSLLMCAHPYKCTPLDTLNHQAFSCSLWLLAITWAERKLCVLHTHKLAKVSGVKVKNLVSSFGPKLGRQPFLLVLLFNQRF